MRCSITWRINNAYAGSTYSYQAASCANSASKYQFDICYLGLPASVVEACGQIFPSANAQDEARNKTKSIGQGQELV
jgi:hypothetical protein